MRSLAKDLLSRAKELASSTAQELQQRAQDSIARTQETLARSRDEQLRSLGAQPRSEVVQDGSEADSKQQVVLSPPQRTPLEVQVDRLRQQLLSPTINLANVQRLAYQGVPDTDNLRTLVWKLLLGYLPVDASQWSSVLHQRRTQYTTFCEDLIVDPSKASLGAAEGGISRVLMQPTLLQEQRSEGGDACSAGGLPALACMASDPLRAMSAVDVTAHDHPLSLSHTSTWNTYFKDHEIMVQVERDVRRTHPSMAFFTGDTPQAEAHREELKRALFMYAKLNPGLRYIQGMNELIAPLYYLFKHDPDLQARSFAEADAFWCFLELISEFRDHFCQQLDNESTGIRATIRRLMDYLQHFDTPLWRHIEITQKVDPQFYAFRWITLLLSQEFSFHSVLRIWDTLLSDPFGRSDCLLRVCTAMILNVRDVLLAGDFTVIMKTLQRYPPVDVEKLLAMAASMPAVVTVLGPSAHPN